MSQARARGIRGEIFSADYTPLTLALKLLWPILGLFSPFFREGIAFSGLFSALENDIVSGNPPRVRTREQKLKA